MKTCLGAPQALQCENFNNFFERKNWIEKDWDYFSEKSKQCWIKDNRDSNVKYQMSFFEYYSSHNSNKLKTVSYMMGTLQVGPINL